MDDLKGKTILITGGTTGIGRATAVLLASHGADIFIFGRHEKELNDALSDIERLSGREAFGMTADVADAESIRSIFAEIDQKFHKLDVLVNNAGLGARSIMEMNYVEMEYILNVNLTGYLLCSKFALERMLKVGKGHIVNIGSMSADVREAGADLYVATKSAVAGFTESLRKYVNDDCIKVTLIEPGNVGTDLVKEAPAGQMEEEKNQIMLKAEDIAECIYFALSRPARCDIIDIKVKPHRQII